MKIASEEIRQRAIAAYKSGSFTQQQLAVAYGVHYKTIQYWLRMDEKTGSSAPQKRGCRPRIFSPDDEAQMLQLIENDPTITLEAIVKALNKTCNVSVVYRTLLRLGVTYKKDAKGVRARS